MQSQFEQLMEALGDQLGISLSSEKSSCGLQLKDSAAVIQLEMDKNSVDLIVGCKLGVIMKGPYRERMFPAAMQVNGCAPSSVKGFLAFGSESEQLYLYDVFRMSDTDGESLANYVKEFDTHAQIWMSAIEKNDLPALQDLGIYLT